jgi:excisionase family DNA binding protein
MDDKALTLKEAANLLGIGYSTIVSKRKQLGFRLPGSRVWRIWRSTLYEYQQNRSNITPLSLRGIGEPTCQSSSTQSRASTTSISPSQVDKELSDLLGLKTK